MFSARFRNQSQHVAFFDAALASLPAAVRLQALPLLFLDIAIYGLGEHFIRRARLSPRATFSISL